MRDEFIANGFVRIDGAFSRELAAECREILWRDLAPCTPDDRSTWTKPVIRLYDYPQAPFREAANTPVLRAAYDTLAGPGGWAPRASLGTFPIRFPHPDDPGDAGWHVDASFANEQSEWCVNAASKSRALLMLFLFSDIGDDDAPTRIRIGSHLDMPRILAPHGDAGVSVFKLDYSVPAGVHRAEARATGEAGTVYLCHPFLVHGAQKMPVTAKGPRFLAQPPLYPAGGETPAADSAVAEAIRLALG